MPVVAEGVLHGVVLGGGGDDAISVQTGGVVEGGIDAGSGNDTVKLTGSDAGGLSAPVMGTAAEPADIDLGAGADRFEMIGGTVFGNLNGEGGEDPPGADTFLMSGSTITSSVFGLGGGNSFEMTGGVIDGSIFAGSQDDVVLISGTANIQGDAAIGPDAIGLEDGNDTQHERRHARRRGERRQRQ